MVSPPPGVSVRRPGVPPIASVEAAATAPGRGRRRWCCRCRRAAGTVRTSGRVRSADAGPAVDHPQLDPVAQRAGGQQRRRLGRAVAERVAGQVDDDPLQDGRVRLDLGQRRPGCRPHVLAGRAAGRPERPATISSSAVSGGNTDSAPACSLLMSSRLSDQASRAGPGDSSAVASSSSRSSAGPADVRRAAGWSPPPWPGQRVRRSWLTAASSAVRIRSASAIGLAASASADRRC